jgi:hypothetical protein
MVYQSLFRFGAIVGLMVTEVEMSISEVLLHFSDLIDCGLSSNEIIFIRFNRSHLCASNRLVLEEVRGGHWVRVTYLKISLLC